MIESILALGRTSAILIAPIVLAAYAFIFSLVIICLVRVSRYFRTAGKEQKLIRMELGKVAEEVHLIRQEIKDGKAQKSSDKSG